MSGRTLNDIRKRFKNYGKLSEPPTLSTKISSFQQTLVISNSKSYHYIPLQGPSIYYKGNPTNKNESVTIQAISSFNESSWTVFDLNYSFKWFDSSPVFSPDPLQGNITVGELYDLESLINKTRGPIFNMKNASQKIELYAALSSDDNHLDPLFPTGFDLVFDKIKQIGNKVILACSTNSGSLKLTFFESVDPSSIILDKTVDTGVVVESYDLDVYEDKNSSNLIAVVVGTFLEGAQEVMKAFIVNKNSSKVSTPLEFDQNEISRTRKIVVKNRYENYFAILAYDELQNIAQVWELQLKNDEKGNHVVSWCQGLGIIKSGKKPIKFSFAFIIDTFIFFFLFFIHFVSWIPITPPHRNLNHCALHQPSRDKDLSRMLNDTRGSRLCSLYRQNH